MACISTILEDDSRLSIWDRRLFSLESILALICGIAVFMLMVLAVISVSGRHAINQPLPGYVDWIEQAMPLIAFLGISYCQRLGGHIRMDILVGRMKGRLLWAMELLSTTIIFVFVLLLLWGTWSHFDRSFDFNAPLWSRDSTIDIRLPLWPAKLLVPVCFAVLALRLGIQIIAYWKAFTSGAERPVAVPMVEDAATQAAKEAASVSDGAIKEGSK